MSDVVCSRTLQRKLPDGRVMIATAQLVNHGNPRPHFSVTGEEWRSQRDLTRHRNTGSEAGLLPLGAMGETLTKVFPGLDTVERLHLSDDTGAPMHAVANGWYWYSDYDGKGANANNPDSDWGRMSPHERAAHHLRVSADELPAGMDRDAFAAYVETLRDRWQAEADAAREWIERVAS